MIGQGWRKIYILEYPSYAAAVVVLVKKNNKLKENPTFYICSIYVERLVKKTSSGRVKESELVGCIITIANELYEDYMTTDNKIQSVTS